MTYLASTLVLAALILYTRAVWLERTLALVTERKVKCFSCGFICDVTGTGLMTIIAINNHSPISVHGIFGIIALATMAGHWYWANKSFKNPWGKWGRYFHRGSLWAWGFWLFVFILGIPKLWEKIWAII